MESEKLDNETRQKIINFQRNEITEHIIYLRLSKSIKDFHNSEVLKRISNDELNHYNFWKKYSGQDVKPSRWMLVKYYLISKIIGLTFGIKLMEKGEESAQQIYKELSTIIPSAEKIMEEENEHEKQLIDLMDEEKLKYVGSIVLGLNDALVELTGALAGLTFAFQNTRVVALAGLITGIAASFSMAASEYLSTKAEGETKNPFNAAIYTGIAYIVTVLVLILPYLLFSNYFFCLGFTLINAILVILFFTFYLSVVKEISFKHRFFEMVGISLGIAALTFVIGVLLREVLNFEI